MDKFFSCWASNGVRDLRVINYNALIKMTYFCVGTELRTKENFPVTWHKN